MNVTQDQNVWFFMHVFVSKYECNIKYRTFSYYNIFRSISSRLEPNRNMNYFVMERYLMYIVFPSN